MSQIKKTCFPIENQLNKSILLKVVEGRRHHFTLMSCNPDYTVVDINSDVVE